MVISPDGRNILRGISRAYIFELCAELGIYWQEKNIAPYDVLTADEAFVTATPFCVLPVMRINGQNIRNGDYGKITRTLLSKWSENVGVDIEQQIRYYSGLVNQGDTASAYQLKYDK